MRERHFTWEEASAQLPWPEETIARLTPLQDGLAQRHGSLLELLRQRSGNGTASKDEERRRVRPLPVLCKRAYQEVLRSGACYVRSRRKPETSELLTQADMRDLLELATYKRLQAWLALFQRLGLILLPSAPPAPTGQFEQQQNDIDE